MADEKTIVILPDDTEIMATAYKVVLRSAGYDARTYPDGQKALEAIRALSSEERARTVVLSDVEMPNMTGEELRRALATEFPDMPFALASANVVKAREENGIPQNVRIHTKPFADNPAMVQIVKDLEAKLPVRSASSEAPKKTVMIVEENTAQRTAMTEYAQRKFGEGFEIKAFKDSLGAKNYFASTVKEPEFGEESPTAPKNAPPVAMIICNPKVISGFRSDHFVGVIRETRGKPGKIPVMMMGGSDVASEMTRAGVTKFFDAATTAPEQMIDAAHEAVTKGHAAVVTQRRRQSGLPEHRGVAT